MSICYFVKAIWHAHRMLANPTQGLWQRSVTQHTDISTAKGVTIYTKWGSLDNLQSVQARLATKKAPTSLKAKKSQEFSGFGVSERSIVAADTRTCETLVVVMPQRKCTANTTLTTHSDHTCFTCLAGMPCECGSSLTRQRVLLSGGFPSPQ